MNMPVAEASISSAKIVCKLLFERRQMLGYCLIGQGRFDAVKFERGHTPI